MDSADRKAAIDPRKDPNSTGWRIRDERTNHWNNERTSQEALSKAVRVSKQTVTNWESGRSQSAMKVI